jgi:hypothetical protein
MNRVAVESEFMSAFDVRLQVINFAASVDELGGKFSFRKIFLLVKYLFQIFGKCLTQRYDYAIYPICFSYSISARCDSSLGCQAFRHQNHLLCTWQSLARVL